MAAGADLRQNPRMASENPRLGYSEVELRSYLPSGWGLRPGSAESWDAKKRIWSIEVYDSADNLWPLQVAARDAEAAGRLEALRKSVDRLYRVALA